MDVWCQRDVASKTIGLTHWTHWILHVLWHCNLTEWTAEVRNSHLLLPIQAYNTIFQQIIFCWNISHWQSETGTQQHTTLHHFNHFIKTKTVTILLFQISFLYSDAILMPPLQQIHWVNICKCLQSQGYRRLIYNSKWLTVILNSSWIYAANYNIIS